jgi:hypothetical protein
VRVFILSTELRESVSFESNFSRLSFGLRDLFVFPEICNSSSNADILFHINGVQSAFFMPKFILSFSLDSEAMVQAFGNELL